MFKALERDLLFRTVLVFFFCLNIITKNTYFSLHLPSPEGNIVPGLFYRHWVTLIGLKVARNDVKQQPLNLKDVVNEMSNTNIDALSIQ